MAQHQPSGRTLSPAIHGDERVPGSDGVATGASPGVGPLSNLSLFDHATRLVAEHGDGPLPRGGEPLPDEPPPDPSKLRYGPGVTDGMGAVHAGPG